MLTVFQTSSRSLTRSSLRPGVIMSRSWRPRCLTRLSPSMAILPSRSTVIQVLRLLDILQVLPKLDLPRRINDTSVLVLKVCSEIAFLATGPLISISRNASSAIKCFSVLWCGADDAIPACILFPRSPHSSPHGCTSYTTTATPAATAAATTLGCVPAAYASPPAVHL